MPTYNARCEKCTLTFEYNAGICHEESPPCVNCQGETTQTVIKNETGFILRGDGFHAPGGHK